tara:strand:+ start:200 stop:793 length:594 start_codon:yes stop_codon:yes gene_type:complete
MERDTREIKGNPNGFKQCISNPEIYFGHRTYGICSARVQTFESGRKLFIGNYCSVAGQLNIMLGGNHNTKWASTFPFVPEEGAPYQSGSGGASSKGDILIGNDVWIGEDVQIFSGVMIGHGSVIGSRAVIAKDVEPYSIVVGNPQTVVRKRFNNQQIKKLLKLKWWNLEDKVLEPLIPIMCKNDNINEFIKQLELIK